MSGFPALKHSSTQKATPMGTFTTPKENAQHPLNAYARRPDVFALLRWNKRKTSRDKTSSRDRQFAG